MNAKLIFSVFLISLMTSCDLVEHVESRAQAINKYEDAALSLSKHNRELERKISQLQFEIEELKSKNSYLKIQLEKSEAKKVPKREVASVPPVAPQNDLVKFDVYKWTPSQLLAVAEKEFEKQNYEKAAQYFHSFSHYYPKHEKIDDNFLFQAGVAAYESEKHNDWVLQHLGNLVTQFPASPYYRGAKLWMGLTQLRLGHHEDFFKTVEEFRIKYRNTAEWKVISKHYEKIVQKYKSH